MFWSVGEVEMDPLTHSLTHSLHAKSPEEAAYTDPLRIGEGGLSLHGADEDFFGSTSTVTQRGEGQQPTQGQVSFCVFASMSDAYACGNG